MARKKKERVVDIPIKQWSYSRYNTHYNCPFRFKREVVDGAKFPPSSAMIKGSKVHKLAENFLKHSVEWKDIKEYYSCFEEDMKWLLEVNAKPELKWAFTENWKDLTGFFSEDVWCRIVTDALAFSEDTKTALIVDFKTGKQYDDHEKTLELYTIGVMSIYDVETVKAEMWYLEHDCVLDKEYTRDQLPELKSRWLKRITPLLSDTKFNPNPSHLCSYCPFSKRKGDGSCKF